MTHEMISREAAAHITSLYQAAFGLNDLGGAMAGEPCRLAFAAAERALYAALPGSAATGVHQRIMRTGGEPESFAALQQYASNGPEISRRDYLDELLNGWTAAEAVEYLGLTRDGLSAWLDNAHRDLWEGWVGYDSDTPRRDIWAPPASWQPHKEAALDALASAIR